MPEAFKLSIDYQCFTEKPGTEEREDLADYLGNPRSEAQILGARLGREVKVVSQKQLEDAIENGQTICPSVYGVCPKWKRRRRTQDLWESAQSIFIDFDNKENICSDKKLIKIIQDTGLDFTILHKSFSWTPEQPKYHGVILLDEPVYDAEEYLTFLLYIRNLFGEKLDGSCTELARMFYSGPPKCITYRSSFRGNLSLLRSLVRDCGEELLMQKYKKSGNQKTTFEYSGPDGDIDVEDFDRAIEEQNERLRKLDILKRNEAIGKLQTELRGIGTFDGKFGNRYKTLFNTARALSMMRIFAPSLIKLWMLKAVASNSYFDGYDKDVEKIIENGINFGRKIT